MSSLFDSKCMWGLEKNTFKHHFADYIWMLVLGLIGSILSCFLIPSYIYIGISLRYMVLYYWARRNPFLRVNLYMIPLKSTFLPYALLVLNFLMSAEYVRVDLIDESRVPWSGIVGLVLGHTYYFCRDIIPIVMRHRRKHVPYLTRAPTIM